MMKNSDHSTVRKLSWQEAMSMSLPLKFRQVSWEIKVYGVNHTAILLVPGPYVGVNTLKLQII